jgi:hypothetical protein
MTINYTITDNELGKNIIKSDGEKITIIPINEDNADYQAYLNKDTLPSNSSIPQAGE